MSFVVSDPLKQFFIFHAAVCDSKPNMNQFRIRAINADTVHFKESKHNICTDSLVSIDKCMIGNQRVPQPGSLFFF